jgi:hypothetical protein
LGAHAHRSDRRSAGKVVVLTLNVGARRADGSLG